MTTKDNFITTGVLLDLAVRLSIVAAGKTLTPEEINELFQSFESEILDQFKDNDRVTALETFKNIWGSVAEVSEILNK